MINNRQKEMQELFDTNIGQWDKQIAFSPKDVALMLDLPLSTVTTLCRERKLVVFKVGRHYRVRRIDLFRYIDQSVDDGIII